MAIAYLSAGHGSHTLSWYRRNHPEALDSISRAQVNFMTKDPATRQRVLSSLGLDGASIMEPTDIHAGGPEGYTYGDQDKAKAANEAAREAEKVRNRLFGDDWGQTTANDNTNNTMMGTITSNGYRIKQESSGRYAVLGEDRRVGSYDTIKAAKSVANSRETPGGYGDNPLPMPGDGGGLGVLVIVGVLVWAISEVL